jgi:hypothetical protein
MDALDALMQRCLAKHAGDRPRDADEMVAAIESVERGLGVVVASTKPPKAVSVFSPSGFIAALPPELAPSPVVVKDQTPGMGTSTSMGTFTTTGEEAVVASRRGMWLVAGALAILGVIVVAIVVAAGGHKRAQQAVVHADATTAVADAAIVVVAPVDAAVVIDAPRVVEVPHPPVKSHKAEIDEHLANALAAQQSGKRMTQVTQAHAAYLLDPKNVRAVLLLADGLLAEGDLEHGCKYLRELGHNPVAQQRMRSASCPAD